jgi:hypothetical protein
VNEINEYNENYKGINDLRISYPPL